LAPPAGSLVERVAGLGLAVWAFLLISRAPEFVAELTGNTVPIRPFFILYPAMLALLLLSGAALRLPNSKIAVALALLTAWFTISVPFSLWRGGSARWLLFRWMPNMLTFAAFAALIIAFAQWSRVARAIGWATPVIALSVVQMGREDWMGRVSTETGTLANANELAALLVVSLPFWVGSAQVTGSSMLRKLVVYGSLPVFFYLVFRTGSRSGVLALALLVALFVLELKGVARLAVIAVASIVAGGIFVVMPPQLKDRMTTLFADPGEAQEMAAISAAESAQLRKTLLLKSIKGALTNPLFGVGPGLFTVYSGYEAENEGKFYGWREAHNTYAQIASEGGLPAIGFFLTAVIASLLVAIRVHRAARRRADLADMRRDAYAFLMSLAGLSFFALFDSIHHLPPLFMMFGLAGSLSAAAAPLLQAPPPAAPPASPPARVFHATRPR
jgi:O-antigen ligase